MCILMQLITCVCQWRFIHCKHKKKYLFAAVTSFFVSAQKPRVSLRVLGFVLFEHQVDILLEGVLLEGFRHHEL